MKKCILLVEDNQDIVKINARMLEIEGYEVRVARTLQQATWVMRERRIDLIVLDIMLPDGSGVDFCRKLRETSSVPILFLTALGEKEQIVAGIKSGGDDYLAKPYDLDVLLLRIEAILRRVSMDAQINRTRHGPLAIDHYARRAYLDGEDVNLTSKEFGVLVYLLNHADVPSQPGDIYRAVWGLPASDNSSVVRMHISTLRRKLRVEERDDLEIENVFRGGYRLSIRGHSEP